MRNMAVVGVLLLLTQTAPAAPPAAHTLIEVTVHLRTADHSAVRGGYVALVPEWRPSRAPVAEQIVERGVARFQVTPGKYFVIGGAPGYGIESRGPVALDGSEVELSIDLSPLEPVTGTIQDENDRPVAGARVSTINGAVIPALGKLSDLAIQHLSPDFSASTGDDGAWTLRLPKGAAPLLFEASGRAPVWRIIPETRPDDVGVTLRRGSALSIATDREDRDLVVTLSREDSRTSPAIPVDRERMLWARSAKDRVLVWSSLPAGSYAVYAGYPAPSFFRPIATRIGAVVLAEGERQHVRMTLPGVTVAATTRAAMFLPETLPAALGNQVQAFGHGRDGGALPLEHSIEEAIGGSVLHLRVSEDSRPPFFAISEEHFVATNSPLGEVRHERDGAPPKATLRWRADVDAQFRSLEKELQIPRSGLARLYDCRSGGDVTVPFNIRSNGFAVFQAAAECRSLVLALEPFEPVVMTRMLRRGEQNLGELVLRAAATADVRVMRDPGEEVISGAVVEVVAMGDGDPASSPVVVARSSTNETGWVCFPALPAYRELRAVATGPDGSRSEAVALRLSPREAGLIDPLRIGAPANLVIDAGLDEAFLTRFPSARISTLWIKPVDAFRESEKLQESVSQGAVRFGPLAAGQWLVSALVMVTRTAYAPFEIGVFELSSGETRKIKARITPNVFEGIVTSNGKPVAAKVMLDDGDRILGSQSDNSGLFQIVLERAGIYHVAVARLSAQGNDIPIGNVAFTDPSRPIEIAIPESASAIVQVRVDDRPARAGTLVTMSRRTEAGLVDRVTMRGRATDSAGKVAFEDLAPGIWTFFAEESETGRRAEKGVTIEAGQRRTVELVLAQSSAIEGTVRDLGGMPLPRARIECIFIGRSGNFNRAGAISDGEGAFSIPLFAPPATSVLCAVVSPTGSVDAFRTTPGEHGNFTMGGGTGTLRIPAWAQMRDRDDYWLVSPDGRPISLSTVATAFGQSRTMMIPALAAGRWRLIRVETLQQWLALGSGLGASISADAEFTVRTGATETIQADGVPAPSGHR